MTLWVFSPAMFILGTHSQTRVAGYFPYRCKFSRISQVDSQLKKIYFKLGYCVKFNYGLLIFPNINLLRPMQDSIKQQNIFTTIAAANVEVIAIYRGCYEWF